MKKIYFSLFIYIFVINGLKAQKPRNLRDSLLQFYTIEELEQMPLRKFGNIVRRLRGHKLLPEITESREKVYDEFGIKIIKDIPKEKAKKWIDEKVKYIDEHKQYYKQEVFPNSVLDVVNGYVNSIYISYLDRDLSEDYQITFQTIDGEILEENDTSIFSNYARRIYYFNKLGKLRLITREVGYNLMEGSIVENAYNFPYKYFYEAYYVWNDSLIYQYDIGAEQYIGGFPEYHNPIEIDTTDAHCKSSEIYFYKHNSFDFATKSGFFKKEKWKGKFSKVPFSLEQGSRNGNIPILKKLLLERKEYYEDKKYYLNPAPTSFFKPYVIEAKE